MKNNSMKIENQSVRKFKILERLCSVNETVRRQAETIANILVDLLSYTYVNYAKKLNDELFAACYTLYLVYTPSMLRDLLLTVLTLREILPIWRDLFLIIAGAFSLYAVSSEKEIRLEAKPVTKTAHISVSEFVELSQMYEETLTKLGEVESLTFSKAMLKVVSYTFALSTTVLVSYLCSIDSDEDPDEHIRRVMEYAISEESRRAMSEYYDMLIMTTA